MSGQNDQQNGGEGPALDPTSKGIGPPSEAPGFDGLTIEREIDRGGMGIVYEALDETLGRKVALKVISPGLANDPVFRKRFIAESKAVASLDNPHILPIYRAGEENGRLFIVTKLIAGGNLGEALEAKGRFTPEETARVITQLGDALEEAHGKGLIHRDIKPANILVDRSGTKPNYLLTDFGLTRKASEETGITKTGEVLGTVGYMAPEQIEGQTVDRRADVYALGCLAAELLSGEPPFAKETKRATLLAHLYDEPTLPADIKVPDEEGANQVLLRAMAKDPDNRYRSSADFAHDLSSRLASQPSEVRGHTRDPHANSTPRPNARKWVVGLVAGLAAIALLPVAFVLAASLNHALTNPEWGGGRFDPIKAGGELLDGGNLEQIWHNNYVEGQTDALKVAEDFLPALLRNDSVKVCGSLSAGAYLEIGNLPNGAYRNPERECRRRMDRMKPLRRELEARFRSAPITVSGWQTILRTSLLSPNFDGGSFGYDYGDLNSFSPNSDSVGISLRREGDSWGVQGLSLYAIRGIDFPGNWPGFSK